MDDAQNSKTQTDDKGKLDDFFMVDKPQQGSSLGEKEKEMPGPKEMVIEPAGKEIEPPKEVEKAGVKLKKEEVKLPPPIEKMGVKTSGATQSPPPAPTVTLPISDDQVMSGLAAPVVSSFRWLAEFCLRQLKKAHLGLKKIHGKVVRIKDGI